MMNSSTMLGIAAMPLAALAIRGMAHLIGLAAIRFLPSWLSRILTYKIWH
jgi:hypothetical protein